MQDLLYVSRIMDENIDFRGLVYPLPGILESEQLTLIEKFKPSEIYTVPRNAELLDVIKQQRKPRAVVVSHIVCVAHQKGKVSERFASLLEFKDEIHVREGFILEAKTNRRSNIRADWYGMKEDARVMLGRIIMGAKSAINGRRGAIAYDYNDRDLLTMLRIMTPGVYANDDDRIRAIAEYDVKPVPQRTWLLTKLRQLARERGLLK